MITQFNGFSRLLLPSRRLVRVWCYFTCVFVALTGVSTRALYAQVKEGALAFGRELAGLSDLTSDAEALVVNGVRLRHASVIVAQPLSAVLDRLEDHCARNAGLLGQSLRQVAEQYRAILARHKAPPGALGRGIVREQADGRGMVVCFVDDRPRGLADLRPAVERFVETSDLTAFGAFVYSFAERRDDGATRLVTLWTERGLDLSRVFPATGDATGSDSAVLPRPPRSRRTLSAAAEGKTYGLRVYASSEPAQRLGSFYDEWMRRQGWARAASAPDEQTAVFLRRDGYQAFVSFSRTEGLTYVTLTEAGRNHGESIAGVHFTE